MNTKRSWKNIPGREDMSKGPEAGSCLVCSRNHKEQVELKQNEPEESMGDEVRNTREQGKNPCRLTGQSED